ncbi:calcium/proton exchanger [Tanacetum coccineum]
MSKGKKDKNRVFVVNLKHDGIFSPYPFSYIHGDEKQLTDFDFEGMSYDNLRELVRKMVHSPVSSLYYCKVGKTIKQGLCRLENDADVQEFLKTGYESKWVVDLYVEHHGYDPMDYKNSNDRDYDSPDSSDAYCSSDDEQVIDYVDFYHEGEQDVVVKNITTNDPFLTKLCSNNGNFRGFINEPIPVNEDLHIEDPDSSSLEPTHQIQRGIAYPRHDPLQPWNEMQPILGMRYDHPGQLKLALANYGVAGRNKQKGEGSSRNSDVSPKWTKSKIASKHKCARNYNLGSLVTYKWIARHFEKEIIEDPFMPLLKMKAVMREKFLINVSLGQCKRAKQRALYDFKGGLIEHYARLWEYRQAILDTNPGSTCILDDEETEYGNSYFRRFYICFKRVKDGWKAGCKRVIGLDVCFLKHTCRGELLTAIGRDANNQMYPIAWAVVKVENFENWSWFISLKVDDLELGHGLLDAVSDWLPNAEHMKCTRHVFANFKKKFSGVQLQRLFWQAAGTTVESIFYNNMDQNKEIRGKWQSQVQLNHHLRFITRTEEDLRGSLISMDKSKITRKQSKVSKHGHENQKSSKRSQRSKALANFLLQGPILQFPKVIYNLKERKERQGPNV